MTIQAIQHRLVAEVEEVDRVHANAGFGATPSGYPGRGPAPDAPF